MKGWNLKMSLPNHLCLVKSWLRFASQLQLAKLCFQTEIQLLINNLYKWVCHSLEILAISSNQDICIFKMPPYLCYRNFTLHSDCLGIVTIPEIYKYVSSTWLPIRSVAMMVAEDEQQLLIKVRFWGRRVPMGQSLGVLGGKYTLSQWVLTAPRTSTKMKQLFQ